MRNIGMRKIDQKRRWDERIGRREEYWKERRKGRRRGRKGRGEQKKRKD